MTTTAIKRNMAIINVVGGIAVLGSYAHGVLTHPGGGDAVWGGVPDWLKPTYTVSMLSAAVGYLTFAYFLFFRCDAERSRVGGVYGLGVFNVLFLAILIPSALWMPLTFAMLAEPSLLLWASIRVVLGIVGLASLGIIAGLLALRPRVAGVGYRLAVAGSLAFAVQTALLDALVWPAYFP